MQLINDLKSSPNIRSLVCDNNGIVIAETVYRCMFCATIFDSLDTVQLHYHKDHLEEPVRLQEELFLDNSNEIDYDNDDFDTVIEENFVEGHNSIIQENDDGNSSENFELDLIPSSKSNQTLKGGSVTCEVCGLTKFYSHISRRYGVFSCESCAKFFYRYCQKPVPYTCPSTGNCSLKIDSPGARCKSCLLNACLNKYVLDPKKHSKIFKKHFNINSNIKTSSAISEKTSKENSEIMLKNQIETGKKSKSLICPNNMSKKRIENKLSKYRRMACRFCKGCLADDCGKCLYCLDKPKFGGNDVKKQKCLKRRCLLLK